MTVVADDGPLTADPCDWCAQPCSLYTAPLCSPCSRAKPGDLVRASMERMLTRARAARAA